MQLVFPDLWKRVLAADQVQQSWSDGALASSNAENCLHEECAPQLNVQVAVGHAESAAEMMQRIVQMTALLRGLNMNLKALISSARTGEDSSAFSLEASTAAKAFCSARECHRLAREIPQTLSQADCFEGEGFESTYVLLHLGELQACIADYLEYSIGTFRRAAPEDFSQLVQELLTAAVATDAPPSAVEESDEVLCKVRCQEFYACRDTFVPLCARVVSSHC